MSTYQNAERRRFLTSSSSSNLTTDTAVSGQQSGGEIATQYFALVDKYGQIVGSDSTSKIRAIVDTSFSSSNKSASAYPPVIEGST